MPVDASLLIGLDALSAILTLVLAVFFGRVFRQSRSGLDLLLFVGFTLIGASFFATTMSEFDIGPASAAADYTRLAGQLSGVIVLVTAYASVRVRGRPEPVWALGWAAAAFAVLTTIVIFVIPPFAALPPVEESLPFAHAAMALGWLACAFMASRGWLRHATWDRALAPIGYLALATSKYTWMMIDLSHDKDLVILIYFWRFVAIFLLLAALLIPRRAKGGRSVSP